MVHWLDDRNYQRRVGSRHFDQVLGMHDIFNENIDIVSIDIN